jgi:hypothetical protein
MKLLTRKSCFLLLAICACAQVWSQTNKPNVQDTSLWKVINRSAEVINEDGRKGIRLSELPNDGYMILKETEFTSGVIEFDVKGKNVVQQSFVGVAFHGVDEKTYDAIYFRPFNFANEDTARRRRAVQYISMPDYSWEKLRATHPGKYENKVDPVPDPNGWFHVKLIVDGRKIAVFVNNAARASLEVEKLSATTKGGVALWVGNNSGGSFANVSITSLP